MKKITLVAVAFAAAAFIVSGCSLGDSEEQAMGPAEALHAELVAAGADEATVDCVLQLGKREIERAAVSAVAADELRVICERTTNAETLSEGEPSSDNGSESKGETVKVNQPFTHGDDAQLDEMWTACEDGTGVACDQLFDEAPVGSEYEQFGVSCGERDDILNCTELDEVEIDDELVPQIYREWEQTQDADGTANQDGSPTPIPAAAGVEKEIVNPAEMARADSKALTETELLEPGFDTLGFGRAEKILAASSDKLDDAISTDLDRQSDTSPEVAGLPIAKPSSDSDRGIEGNNPLADLDPAIEGLVNP